MEMNRCALIFLFCFLGFIVLEDATTDSMTDESLHKVASSLEMFVEELPDMPRLEGYVLEHGKLKPTELRIGMFETKWKFHSALPPTTVFAYGASKETATVPGPTIEAIQGTSTFVRWENHLPSRHFLPWDPTLKTARAKHGGVPTVVHLHGGIHEPESDGNSQAWFTAGFNETGPAWKKPLYHYNNIQHPGNLCSAANHSKNKRFGYDNMGGYDRSGMGGRSGYVDERPHSRHLGRASGGFQGGSPDWSGSGRAGFGEMGTPQREGLMTYKQFIAELEDDISPAEAERRYQEYRTEYITTQKRAFFEAHKDEDWLKDKYDPSHLEAVIQRRNENAKATAKEFLLDLQNGTLEIGPSSTGSIPSSAKGGQGSDHNSDDDAEVSGKRRRHGRGPAKENDPISSAPKAPTVSSEPRRVKKDIELGQALIRKLDTEKGIEENILGSSEQDKFEGDKSISGSIGVVIVRGTNTVKGLEGLELLDVVATYLWRVHGLDYYGMIELKEPPKGLRHVRAESKNNHDEQSTAAAEWEKKLESTWQARLQGQDPLEIMAAKDKLEAATNEALDPFVRKIRDDKYGWKYGCGAKGCAKMFHATEFVHKHLRLKHPDLIGELTSKVCEEVYFQNYMNDPDAPGVTLTTQQPGQRDKARRRKVGHNIAGDVTMGSGSQTGGASRARDVDHPDRATRRENERTDRSHEDDRYDRNDDSSPRDYQSIPGGQDVGHHDPSMFDPFAGPGMRGPPPFGSDMPPHLPVFMPVPGAGPLGPFVPAPPEVAMRMLREQGGPAPFHPNENNGGLRGRKGRSGGGPSMGGMMDPPMMLPLSPAFRQDPRRIRSYRDLDAPEDEVTVIDYRTL